MLRTILACFYICFAVALCKPWEEDQFDPLISRFIRPLDIDMEYDDEQAVTFGNAYVTTDISSAKDVKLAKWNRVPEGEASYTAIIFDYHDDVKKMGAYPSGGLPMAGYCGGVLLTSDTLITLCACVASWMLWMRDEKGQGLPTQKFDKILPDYDIPFKDIYVWWGYSYFRPWLHDWRVKLTTDPSKQIMENTWCYEAIDKCNVKDKNNKEHLCQRANPAILKFDVPWSYTPETLVPWPPVQFVYRRKGEELEVGAPLAYKQYVKAYHYSYLFRPTDTNTREYYDEYGNWLDIGLALISLNKTLDDLKTCVPFDNCLLKENCTVANKWKLKEGITCFKDEPVPDICGATHGSPVYASDFGLHGLSINEYPCGTQTNKRAESSVLEVMAITPRMAEYIETILPELVDTSKELLPSQHLYRDESDYKMYEMVKYQFEVKDEPHGEAVKVKSLFALNHLLLLLYLPHGW